MSGDESTDDLPDQLCPLWEAGAAGAGQERGQQGHHSRPHQLQGYNRHTRLDALVSAV